ncbi:hypothetical protein PRK78_004388 [Emydomyces testavorans]|uniref:Uncharacterized protein n=1 Tax=Emydomyces testavorans TaxID=2070801 RepID=A0AAF0DHZ3_9EURO|nr:hypothetical protein PRK78_004388 [Emydomyces testavorans]
MAQRIDDAMVEVITKMNSITEHLRVHNFQESANRIARSVHEVINIFTDAVVNLTEDQMVIYDAVKFSKEHTCKEKQSKDARTTRQADLPAPKPAHSTDGQSMVLYSDVARHAPGPTATRSSAQVANSTIARQSATVTNTYRAPTVLGLTSTISSQVNPVVPVGHQPSTEICDEKAAVLGVRGVFGPHSLNFMTSKIREGPLFSVEINYDQNHAEITFQKAVHALSFLEKERIKRAKTGSGVFGASYKIVSAAEFAWDEDLRKMEDKPRERRRLTLARAGLLGGGLSMKKILSDMGQIVGADSVEFIWAFNAGNVTAVFKSVAAARAVRNQLLVMAAHRSNPYYDVQVTFSTDPCEKQLNLESQFGVPQHRRTKPHRSGK